MADAVGFSVLPILTSHKQIEVAVIVRPIGRFGRKISTLTTRCASKRSFEVATGSRITIRCFYFFQVSVGIGIAL